MKKNVVFFCTCIILTGCTPAPKVNTVAEAEVIRNLEIQWTVANQTKDIAKVMTFFSPESVQMVPCLLYTSPSPRDGLLSRMPSSA